MHLELVGSLYLLFVQSLHLVENPKGTNITLWRKYHLKLSLYLYEFMSSRHPASALYYLFPCFATTSLVLSLSGADLLGVCSPSVQGPTYGS